MSRTFRILLWVFLIVVIAIVFGFLLPSFLGLVVTVLLVFAVSDFLLRRRRTTIDAFNSVLKTVVSHGGDLTSVAVSFSKSGPLSGQAYEFARRLMMGQDPLEAAARSKVPLQLSTAVLMQTKLDGGETGGKPRSVNKKLGIAKASANDFDSSFNRNSAGSIGINPISIQGRMLYLFVTASMTLSVMVFMKTFIAPTLELMFEELGMNTTGFDQRFSLTPALLVYLLIVGLILAYTVFSRSSFLGMNLPQWFPTMPRLAIQKSELLHGLADAVDAGWPLGRALAVAHTISISQAERYRLQQTMEWIEQGRSPAEAIHRAGYLPSKDVGWIEQAPPGRLASMLRMVGDRRVRDAYFNLGWTINVIFPVLILILAAVVTICSFGFLSLLYQLIGVMA